MLYKIKTSESADKDLKEIADYLAEYAGKEPTIKYIYRLKKRVFNLLRKFPNSCAKHGKYRYFVIDRYIVIYAVYDVLKKVRIIMFAHQNSNYKNDMVTRA
ncbi:MAG: type II toxin-antitoxin system RelE/ParE family toxin [Magnetococcales bacterium]|nr:type II toxin-antitoxin system RelE/ParE family toxin [Magnetococcales bacterium]